VREVVTRTNDGLRDDTESLASVRGMTALGPAQELWIRGVAWSTRRIVAQLRGDRRMAEVLEDIEKGRLAIVRRLADRGPVLTEDAWEALLAERDGDVIAWWIALLGTDSHELHFSQVRRALLENRELLRHTMSIANDAKKMDEMEELIRNKQPGALQE